jgi:VWFA-related protein
MRIPDLLKRLSIFSVALLALTSPAFAQEPPSPTQTPDVIKVETSLVQTDVMVFDKQGKFVDGLKREQFALKVEGKPRQLSFFEEVLAGSANEEAQLAAARGRSSSGPNRPVPLDRGRTIFFFLDDFHLSIGSMKYTRDLLMRFVERDMGQNDQVAIFSTTGQIGFLQQLTDNKRVLLTAIDRLRARPYKSTDIQFPPMSEYQALLIDQNNRDVLDVFVEQILRENPMLGRARAEEEVRGRATTILRLAANATMNTMYTLKKVVEKSRSLPGRKIVFLMSDGFFLDSRNSDAYELLRQTTIAAAGSGLVIYSIDARGLVASLSNAGTQEIVDPTGRLARNMGGELGASQDSLNALANDTGGRAFFNSNNLSAAVATGLKESSLYYLLAWRPDSEEQRNSKYRRLEVSIVGRPDLVVRFRRGVGDESGSSAKKSTKNEQKPASRAEDIREALQAPFPKTDFPLALTLNYVNTAQKGDALVASVRLAQQSLNFASVGGVPTANVLIAGVILDDQGKVLDSFNKRVTVHSKSETAGSLSPDFYYNNYSLIRPGIYQVRVAAADEKGGPAGSASDWIEIPDLAKKQLALSTLIVGERKPRESVAQNAAAANNNQADVLEQVTLNVERRFAHTSLLRFLTFVYNATSAATVEAAGAPSPRPDLAVQVQIFRDNEPVITDPVHHLNPEGAPDLTRIPYAAEVNLDTLAPGRYVLQVTVIDRLAKSSASQRVKFEVD